MSDEPTTGPEAMPHDEPLTYDKPLPYNSKAPDTGFGYAVHHVQLSIPPGSENECRKFYVGILGMAELVKPPVLAARGGIWVRADNLEIHLGVEEGFKPQRKAHPGILVKDLDALARRVAGEGLEPEWDESFPGMQRFYLRDNNGNRLEFLSLVADEPAS